MVDIFSKKKRSEIMRNIRSKNTGPEKRFRKELRNMKIKHFRHGKNLPGKPDFILPEYKMAVFINGCFWHSHTCIDGRTPKSNSQYWRDKIEANKKRDKRNYRRLRGLGWQAVNIWECKLVQGVRRVARHIQKLS